jgi:hypothetical protein
MHVQRGWEPDQGGRSLQRPRRPTPLRTKLALTVAAAALGMLLAVASADRGWLPDAADEALQDAWFP